MLSTENYFWGGRVSYNIECLYKYLNMQAVLVPKRGRHRAVRGLIRHIKIGRGLPGGLLGFFRRILFPVVPAVEPALKLAFF